MFAIEREAVVIRLLAGGDSLTETDDIRGQGDKAAVHQIDGESHVGNATHSAWFFFALAHRLVQADHCGQSAGSQFLWHEQIGGNPIIRLAPDHEMASSVALQIFAAQVTNFGWWPLQVRWLAEDLLDGIGYLLATRLPACNRND